MKILTWNVNGIRAASNKSNSIKFLLDSLDADVICLQETKITRNLLTTDIGNIDGYLAFFSFSKKRSGYSGVVTYCKKSCCPLTAEEGITGQMYNEGGVASTGCYYTSVNVVYTSQELNDLDSEGRAIITEHELEDGRHLCIVNVYCPMAVVDNEERYSFKMKFYYLLEVRCRQLESTGKHVIVVGDMNVSHRRIDHCDPDPDFELSRSRKWFKSIIIPVNHLFASLNQNRQNIKSYSSTTADSQLPGETACTETDQSPKKMEQSSLTLNTAMEAGLSALAKRVCNSTFDSHIQVGSTNCNGVVDSVGKYQNEETVEDDDIDGKDDGEQFRRNLLAINSVVSTSSPFLVCNSTLDSLIHPGSSNCDSVDGKSLNEETVNVDDEAEAEQFRRNLLYTNSVVSTSSPFLVDVFRAKHPTQRNAFTCWNTKERARETNYGTRIDYILTTRGFYESEFFETCDIRPDVHGSDHCPVQCVLKCEFKASSIIPASCAIFMPELAGKQQNIKSYFKNLAATTTNIKRSLEDADQSLTYTSNCKRLKVSRTIQGNCTRPKKDNILTYFGSSSQKNITGGGCIEEKSKSVIPRSNVKSFARIDQNFDDLSKLQRAKSSNDKSTTNRWKGIFRGPEPTPMCSGHNEPCFLQTVKKEGPNIGRQFYCCSRPSGHATNKEARCKFFKWKNK